MKTTPAILLLALVAGCASTTGNPVSRPAVESFQTGRTTQAEVESSLGKPSMAQRLADGRTMLTYIHGTAQVRGATFIPIVGMFAGGVDTSTESYSFMFGSDGRLQSTQESSANISSP